MRTFLGESYILFEKAMRKYASNDNFLIKREHELPGGLKNSQLQNSNTIQ
jgi:hypothetical protein